MKAAQVYASFQGRSFVTPDDVKKMAVPVLSHRILLKTHTFNNPLLQAEQRIMELLGRVQTPVEAQEWGEGEPARDEL